MAPLGSNLASHKDGGSERCILLHSPVVNMKPIEILVSPHPHMEIVLGGVVSKSLRVETSRGKL